MTEDRLRRTTQEEFAQARQEGFAEYQKLGGYLFTAHGAGLVGCLSTLKDTGHIPGIGFFITCFGVGFLFATVSYVSLFFSGEIGRHSKLHGVALSQRDIDSMTLFSRSFITCQVLAGVSLIVAIAAIILKFHSW